MATTSANSPPTTTKEPGFKTVIGRGKTSVDGVKRSAPEGSTAKKKMCFDRDLTVIVELEGQVELTALALIKAASTACGELSACRMINKNKYEITVNDVAVKEKMLDGFRVGETRVHARDLSNDELVVSFMGLPAYIEDLDILERLQAWGVTAVSAVRRRMWPGTAIADGTRYVKVRFTHEVQSLPYSARFITAAGPEFFRVIHDRQVKVCRGCLQPNHVLRECPDFTCRKCGAQGHYARECTEPRARRCETCNKPVPVCSCGDTSGSVSSDSSGDEEVEEGCVVEERGESETGDVSQVSLSHGTLADEVTAPGVEREVHTDAPGPTHERGAEVQSGLLSKAGRREAELRVGGDAVLASHSTPEWEKVAGIGHTSKLETVRGNGDKELLSQRTRSLSRLRREQAEASLTSGLDQAVEELSSSLKQGAAQISKLQGSCLMAPVVSLARFPSAECLGDDGSMIIDPEDAKRRHSFASPRKSRKKHK